MHQRTHGTKHFPHPFVSEFSLDYESLPLPADPAQRLIVYTAKTGSTSEEVLRLLDT